MSQYPPLVVSAPSIEESNDVARDLAEKEVFVDVPADETLVTGDAMGILFSKEQKSGADSHSEPLFCANCRG